MEQNEQSLFDLQIDSTSQSYLSETARWGKFLAIVGFIFCGLIALMAIFAGSIFATASNQLGGGIGVLGGGMVTIFYVLIGLLWFFPFYYLYIFSSKMQNALRSNDQQALQTAFANQKSCYKFVGILTIVMLSIYILAILSMLIFAASLRG